MPEFSEYQQSIYMPEGTLFGALTDAEWTELRNTMDRAAERAGRLALWSVGHRELFQPASDLQAELCAVHEMTCRYLLPDERYWEYGKRWFRRTRMAPTAALYLASCGHPANDDGECDCSSWPERAPLGTQ